MTETKTVSATDAMLARLYKCVTMGADSLLNLLPKVKDENMKSRLTKQLGGYEAEAVEIKKKLDERKAEPETEGFMTKMSAKMGIMMNTMIDSTPSHIAQMVIEGSTMAVTELTKLVREYENTNCSEDCLTFARRIIQFEEENIEKMKEFL